MCRNKEMHDKPSLIKKQNLSHFRQVWDILIIFLSLFICFYSAIILAKKRLPSHSFNPSIHLSNYYQKYF